MNEPTDTGVIWIVKYQWASEYDSAETRVVAWQRSQAEAEELAARLLAEFVQARERALPGHEVADTIWEMLQEHEHAKYVWVSCDREECGHFDRVHTHLAERPLEEHEAAMIEQLRDWWHEARDAWRDFVEHEVMTQMADPPGFCNDLVRDAEVSYECYAISRDPAVTRAWRHDGQRRST